MNNITVPDKPRKHRWVTEALSNKETILSVWPSKDELTSDKKKEKFLETIAKIGNDPRVVKVDKQDHDEHTVVFLFHLEDD